MTTSAIFNRSSGLPFTPLLFTLMLAANTILVIWLFVLRGLDETTAFLFTRYTARVSFMFFLPVFTLQAWHMLLPSTPTTFLMRRRRQLGLAFALAHAVHLGAILLYFAQVGQTFTLDDAPALAIYFLIGLMAITSNTLSMRHLKSAWKVIHKIGLYGVFVGFFVTYLGRVQGYETADIAPDLKETYGIYILLLVLVSSAWLLRIIAFWTKRLSPT